MVVGAGFDVPASQASHYGVEIAATRLGSISDAVALLWAYRSSPVRPDA